MTDLQSKACGFDSRLGRS